MARVEMACRDCTRCTNAAVSNWARDIGRTTAAFATIGASEVGFLFFKKCRQCGHPLSLHSGRTHLTQANREWADTSAAPATLPPPLGPFAATLPRAHAIAYAAAGLSEQELFPHQEGLDALAYMLGDEEEVAFIATGTLVPANTFISVLALVVLTDRRLVVFRSKGDVGPLAWCDPRHPGLMLEFKDGRLGAGLHVAMPDGPEFNFQTISRNARRINAARGDVIYELSLLAEEPPEIPLTVADTLAPPSPAAPGEDAITKLRRLGELHQAGILTDAEFAAQKAKLLDQI